jgi:predicted RNase H-like nuclease
VTTSVIGVDCSTQDKKLGLALGYFEGSEAYLRWVSVGMGISTVIERIAEWITPTSPTLIAIDAPLGWPLDLSQALPLHEAGAPIPVEANRLFRRETDRVVKREIGKQSLDVGADRIARTAHAALDLLQALRKQTGQTIPLAWEPPTNVSTYAIEVYPAATLVAYKMNTPGYKQKDGHIARRSILNLLRQYIKLPLDTTLIEENDHALDAVVCVLAGVDFLRGAVIRPTDIQVAKKEGWIWVRQPLG